MSGAVDRLARLSSVIRSTKSPSNSSTVFPMPCPPMKALSHAPLARGETWPTRFRLGLGSCLMLLALLGCTDPNARPVYGDTGLPKNCRAIIKENIEGWRYKNFTADEALESIDRNCGEHGYSWGQ